MSDSGRFGRVLAMKLLAYEGGNTKDTRSAVAAAGVVCQKLFGEMEQFIGSEGFRVLLARSLDLARTEYPFLDQVPITEPFANWFTDLKESSLEVNGVELLDGVAAVVGGFIDLLGVFIGYDLTLRMVHHCWPDLPARSSYREQKHG